MTFDESAKQKTDLLAETVISKQDDYGQGNILKCPVGPEMGLIVRLSDKLNRLSNLYQSGQAPSNETLKDTWLDVCGYGLIGLMLEDGTFKLPLEDKVRDKKLIEQDYEDITEKKRYAYCTMCDYEKDITHQLTSSGTIDGHSTYGNHRCKDGEIGTWVSDLSKSIKVPELKGETVHGDRVYFDDKILDWMQEVTDAINKLEAV